jgi:HAMP domain-containing protein
MNLLQCHADSPIRSPGGRVAGGRRGARSWLPSGVTARLVALIGLTLLPLLVLVGWQYQQRYEERYAQALQTEQEVARGVAALFTAFVRNVQRSSALVARAIVSFERYTPAKANAVLTEAAAQYVPVRSMSWLAPDGRVLASSAPGLVGRDLSGRGYFRAIRGGGNWAAGDLMAVDSAAAQPAFAIATAHRDGAGTLRGVVVAGLEPSALGDAMRGEVRPEHGIYALFDARGILVYRSPELPLSWTERRRSIESDPLLYRALWTGREQTGVTQLALTGGDWVAARVPVHGIGWVAGSGRPLAAVLGPLRQRLQRDVLLALASAGVALLLAFTAARTIANPLRRLERDAAAFRGGVMEPYADPLAPTEVRRVRQAVEAMASDLRTHALALRDAHQLLTEAERLSHTGAWQWDVVRDR